MGTLTKPFTFAAGGYAVGSQVNADFDTIYNWVNGGSAMWADASVAFTGVPSGPNTDPTTGNQFTRKSWVDGQTALLTKNWGTSGMLLQAGITIVTTDASGFYTITLPSAFPNSLVSCGQWLGQNSQGFNTCQVLMSQNSSKTQLLGRVVHTDTTGGYGSTGFYINWIAIGT